MKAPLGDPAPHVPFNGTLLKPLDQQHDVDRDFIDPRGVRFDPDHDYPVSWDFDHGRRLGTARISRRADGGLVASGLLTTPLPGMTHLAISVNVRGYDRRHTTTVLSDLLELAVTDKHPDPDQPYLWINEG